MPSLLSRRRLLQRLLAGTGLAVVAGCGTILHPERKGQPAGPLDWKIVALDAIGLCLFFVPGVIAFAVDFNNGSIYLPTERPQTSARTRPAAQFLSVQVPSAGLSLAAIEQAVSEKTGREVRLIPGRFRTGRLKRLRDFWKVRDKIAAG